MSPGRLAVAVLAAIGVLVAAAPPAAAAPAFAKCPAAPVAAVCVVEDRGCPNSDSVTFFVPAAGGGWVGARGNCDGSGAVTVGLATYYVEFVKLTWSDEAGECSVSGGSEASHLKATKQSAPCPVGPPDEPWGTLFVCPLPSGSPVCTKAWNPLVR